MRRVEWRDGDMATRVCSGSARIGAGWKAIDLCKSLRSPASRALERPISCRYDCAPRDKILDTARSVVYHDGVAREQAAQSCVDEDE